MYNFETICRTCSSEGELQSLFTQDPLKISDMLTEIVDIKVIEDDNFPQNICTNCVEKLNSAYQFKKRCQDVNNKFELYLNSLSIKNEVIIDSIKEEVNYTENHAHWNETCDSPRLLTSDSDVKPSTTITKSEKVKKKRMLSKKRIKRKYICSICNKSVLNIRDHMRSHTKEKPYKCETCKQEFSLSGNYQRHLKIHTGEKPHECTFCGRSFIQKTALMDHIRVHTNETPFKCKYCEKSYKQQSQLRHHLKIKHANDGVKTSEKNGVYECGVCNKTFASKGILSTHKLFHGEKSYLCNHCGKGFVRRSGLLSHIKVHTGERPYKCTHCDKSFSQMASLNTHQLIHTGEKPYKCTFCQKQFAHRLSYNSHQLIHTGDKPFKCEICNQSFRQKPHLKIHSRTHSGEKPHKCTVCDKQFSLNGNLTVHMRTHTGETPYVCSICNKGFYDSSSMKKHKKKHFPDNGIVEEKSFDLSLVKNEEYIIVTNNCL